MYSLRKLIENNTYLPSFHDRLFPQFLPVQSLPLAAAVRRYITDRAHLLRSNL